MHGRTTTLTDLWSAQPKRAAANEEHASEKFLTTKASKATVLSRTDISPLLASQENYLKLTSCLTITMKAGFTKWHLLQNQPLLRQIFKEPPIISYKKGKSLRDLLVRAKL